MPKTGSSKNRGLKGSKDTNRMPFHLVATSGGTNGVVGLQPAQLGTIIASRADSYELFRVVKLKFRLLPNSSSAAMCYLPGVTDTFPGSIAACSVVPNSTYITGQFSVPSPWVSVPREVLRGYLDWYKTIAGTPDPSVEIQGNLAFFASASATYEIKGTILFSAGVDPANTPMMRRNALIAKEYARWQFILVEGAKTATSSLPQPKLP